MNKELLEEVKKYIEQTTWESEMEYGTGKYRSFEDMLNDKSLNIPELYYKIVSLL